MYEAGARTFVEVGPGRVLTGLVGKILGARPHVAVACDRSGERAAPAPLGARRARGGRRARGPGGALRRPRGARSTSTIPLRRAAASAWLVNGHLARPLSGEIPRGGLRPIPEPVVALALPPVGDDETAVIEYLRTTRAMIEAQRQVMLGFLGHAGLSAADGLAPPVTLPAIPSLPAPAAPPSPSLAPPRASLAPSRPRPSLRPVQASPPSIAPRAARLPCGRPRRGCTRHRALGRPPRARRQACRRHAARDRQRAHGLPRGHARPRSQPRGRAQHRLHQADRDPRHAGAASSASSKDARRRSATAMIEQLATQKTLRGIVEWLERSGATRTRRPAARPRSRAPAGSAAQRGPPAITASTTPRSRGRGALHRSCLGRGRRRAGCAGHRPRRRSRGKALRDRPRRRGHRPAELAAVLEARGAAGADRGPPTSALGEIHGLVHLGGFEATEDPPAVTKDLFEERAAAVDRGGGDVDPRGDDGGRPLRGRRASAARRASPGCCARPSPRRCPCSAVRGVGARPPRAAAPGASPAASPRARDERRPRRGRAPRRRRAARRSAR